MINKQDWVDKKKLNEHFPILTLSRIDQLVWKRQIPFIQFNPKGKVYFHVDSIEKWLNENTIKGRTNQ